MTMTTDCAKNDCKDTKELMGVEEGEKEDVEWVGRCLFVVLGVSM